MTIKQKHKLENFFSLAYREYYNKLVARAFVKLSDRMLGEDLVQTTFLKAWNYMIRGGKIKQVGAFLYHILNHLIIDEYRKRKTLSLENLVEQGFEVSVDDTENLFSFLDGKQALALINRLPKRYHKIMHLRYVEDLENSEIARINGKSKNYISVQMHRGLKLVRDIYEESSSIYSLR